MIAYATLSATLLVLIGSSIAAGMAQPQVLDIGDRLELFVDHYLVDRMTGTELRLNRPVDGGPVLHFDKPWDGPFAAYATVLHDGPLYRLYYRGKPYATPDGTADEVTCYAESSDGIRWRKPDLGLVEIGGSRNNNVILDSSTAPIPHNFTPLIDTRPGVPPGERFKALGGLFDMRGHATSDGLVAWHSADGVRWKKLRDKAVIGREHYRVTYTDTAGSPAFWSETEGRYVCYLRVWKTDPSQPVRQGWGGNVRAIGRTTSKDFIDWSPVEIMDYGDAPLEHLYTNQTSPYFRARHLYLSIAARFMPGRQVISDQEAKAIGVDRSYYRDCSDVILMSTRGGGRFDRTFMEAFLRPDIGPENWTSRTNYPALNVVPTGPREISFYVQRRYGQREHHLVRYTLGTDRFASVVAPYRGGEMLTRPLRFAGRTLLLNFATSAPGSIRVEIQDASGKPVPGYELAQSVETIGNEIERAVSWKSGSDLSRLAGKPVRLRFVMRDAELYALRFR